MVRPRPISLDEPPPVAQPTSAEREGSARPTATRREGAGRPPGARRSRFEDSDGSAPRGGHGCDHPGCEAIAEFRAPRTRDRIGQREEYWWFCLDHIRAYNASWDYYAGMSPAEIEANARADVVGHRPSWRLGWRMAAGQRRDPFGLFDEETPPGADRRRRPLTDEELALETLGLAPDHSEADLKARYKALVKQHHPDIHGGDKAAEERLKAVNHAYTLLKTRFAKDRPHSPDRSDW